MEKDVAPELLKLIQSEFQGSFEKNKKILVFYEKFLKGDATYDEVHDFAIETGRILAETFRQNLSSAILPDGKMYYNIADRVISKTLGHNYELIADAAVQVQDTLNQKAGIGLKAIRPGLNQDRIDGIINRVSSEEYYDDIKWILYEPVINFSQSVVDDAVRENADFQYRAGLSPKIVRTSTGRCCEWCSRLVGIYDYSDVMDTGNSVYRRHERCKCKVMYHAGNGMKQDVHTKRWSQDTEPAKIKARRQVGLDSFRKSADQLAKQIDQEYGQSIPQKLAEHPKILQSYTPQKLKEELEKQGYEVQPLNDGSFKGVAFEDGGGYKINFSDGGILMYHPEQRSHHGGEYYKISTGKKGRHRYDRNGEEIK